MRTKILWLALVVSLGANVFFIAGALYSLQTGPDGAGTAEQRIDSAAEQLKLSAEQRQGLLDLRVRSQERRTAMSGDRDERRGAFLAELAKPDFDRDAMLARIDERAAQRRAFFAGMTEDLHGYLATLSPEQRQAFLDMARERGFLRGILGRSRHDSGRR